MKNKEMAFWKYDCFPFILYGEITEKFDDGTIETKEYGYGNRFRSLKILPYNEGVEIKTLLKTATAERQKFLNMINKGYNAQLNNIFRLLS